MGCGRGGLVPPELKSEIVARTLYRLLKARTSSRCSRKVVGWSIEDREDPDLARHLFERVCRDCVVLPAFVHADNGGPMRGLCYSRPRVSDDNPFIEAFFKTLKYRVGHPKTFKDLESARRWFATFIDWYNTRHRLVHGCRRIAVQSVVVLNRAS